MTHLLRIAINAQIIPGGGYGGVEQFIIGLVDALGRLDYGDEEYIIITHPRAPDWLKPCLGPNQRIVVRPWANVSERVRAILQPGKLVLEPIQRLLRLIRLSRQGRGMGIEKPKRSDGFLERLEVDVVHFPWQSMVLTDIPSIFNPHDLQHLHLPELFAERAYARREANYPVWCREATAVAVASQWVKDDLVQQYGIEREKVYVIPLAAPLEVYTPISEDTLHQVCQKFRLPETFALYPAQTWPHKNHVRLIEAIAELRDQHRLNINLICTGKQNSFWPIIEQRINELRLDKQVRFLGFVSPEELHALYRLAQFTVIPTLFEAGSLPMFEAFYEGTPVACSAVTSLPQQAEDAALLFDPLSVESIAEAMRRMVLETDLRDKLSRRGRERIRTFSWKRTAKAYRALYRKVAGHPMTEEDTLLLTQDWMSSSAPAEFAHQGGA